MCEHAGIFIQDISKSFYSITMHGDHIHKPTDTYNLVFWVHGVSMFNSYANHISYFNFKMASESVFSDRKSPKKEKILHVDDLQLHIESVYNCRVWSMKKQLSAVDCEPQWYTCSWQSTSANTQEYLSRTYQSRSSMRRMQPCHKRNGHCRPFANIHWSPGHASINMGIHMRWPSRASLAIEERRGRNSSCMHRWFAAAHRKPHFTNNYQGHDICMSKCSHKGLNGFQLWKQLHDWWVLKAIYSIYSALKTIASACMFSAWCGMRSTQKQSSTAVQETWQSCTAILKSMLALFSLLVSSMPSSIQAYAVPLFVKAHHVPASFCRRTKVRISKVSQLNFLVDTLKKYKYWFIYTSIFHWTKKSWTPKTLLLVQAKVSTWLPAPRLFVLLCLRESGSAWILKKDDAQIGSRVVRPML